MKLTRLCLIVILITFTFSLKAQENINASGANITSDEGSISYSIGQTVYNTNTGTNGSISEGVQQPYEISVVSGIEEKDITLSISAYPNPTTDYLTLELIEFQNTNFQLININGKILQSEPIRNSYTRINMSNLINGLYFVKVIQNESEIKVFKIIKK
jgi:hypothetical protein